MRPRASVAMVLGLLVGLLLVLPVILPVMAWAHDFKPGLLALVERADGGYDVTWRVPIEDEGSPLRPEFPGDTTREAAGARRLEGDALVERFVVRRPGGLGGQTIRLSGQASATGEVLVRIETRSGQVATGHLSRSKPVFAVPVTPHWSEITGTYLLLGIEHILSGLDHLAFVLLLLLLAPSAGAILGAVTAFTVAHSLTLALAALGLVQVPQAPVEATIALSIVLLARALVLRERAPSEPAFRASRLAGSAFAFGLLHGLGFAGALSSVGLPAGDIPLSLFSFNLGVELGQLAFVAAVLMVRSGVAPMLRAAAANGGKRARLVAFAAGMPTRAAGALGGFWLVDRIVGFFA